MKKVKDDQECQPLENNKSRSADTQPGLIKSEAQRATALSKNYMFE